MRETSTTVTPHTTGMFGRRHESHAGKGQGGTPDGDDDDHPDDSYHQYEPHDIDGSGDVAGLHFAHLLARLRNLVGEEPPIAIVNNLVEVFEHHVRTVQAKNALLKTIIPGYKPSRHSMSFHDSLYQFLLTRDMHSSLQDKLRELKKEGHEVSGNVGGTQV